MFLILAHRDKTCYICGPAEKNELLTPVIELTFTFFKIDILTSIILTSVFAVLQESGSASQAFRRSQIARWPEGCTEESLHSLG